MKIIRTAILSSALTFLMLPAEAAVIDQVKSKVDAIKNDTVTIKNKSNALLKRADEAAATAYAQINETIDIKDALGPLFGLRDSFAQMGFDPNELLEAFPIDDLRNTLDELREQRAEIQDAMSDPDLEVFRGEFLEMLAGISSLVAENGVVEVTPLQTLVERAPLKVIAVLKMASSGIFEDLLQTVSMQVSNVNAARDQGILPNDPFGSLAPSQMTASGVSQLLWDNATGICALWGHALEVPMVVLSGLKYRNQKMLTRLGQVSVMYKGKMDRDHNAQIHGYVGININIGKRAERSIAYYTVKLENRAAKYDLMTGLVGFLSAGGYCDVWAGSQDDADP